MSKASEAIKKTKPVHWFNLRGIKVGAIKLTPNQWTEYNENLVAMQGKHEEWAEYFAKFIVDEDCQQAFTIDEYKEYLSNDEMEYIADEFRKGNGLVEAGELGN